MFQLRGGVHRTRRASQTSAKAGAHDELGSLAAHKSCLMARQQHDDLDDAAHVGDRGVLLPLAPAGVLEPVVAAILGHAWVILLHAHERQGRVAAAVSRDGAHDINDGDPRRNLVRGPDPHRPSLPQQLSHLPPNLRHGRG